LARHPTFTTALLVAARVARDQGDLALAIEHLDRLVELDGGNAFALRDRAEARLVDGNRDGALRDLSEALRLEPENAEIRRRLDSMETADTPPPPPPVEEHEHEPELGDRPILTRTMGDIYARQGFLAQALEVYEHLHSENPDDDELRARLEELKGGRRIDRDEVRTELLEADQQSEVGAAFEAPQTAAHAAPRVRGPGSRTIASYFEDLLAWVPGAVPIASLAPGAPGERSGGRSDAGKTKEEADEFNRWLEGLGT
jgi:tetratricopeptide (TPR) repeat protein